MALASAPLIGTGVGCAPVAAAPGDNWAKHGRIAGAGFFAGYTDKRLDKMLDDMVDAGVSVLEGDSNLSDYLSDDWLRVTLDQIWYVTEKAHERNLKVVWYYPSLEVITPNGKFIKKTMSNDHPDWLQYNLEGKKNIFIGGKEHWVDPTAESAWMCHNSPYRDYFFQRIRLLAETGLDGAWIDVPLFMNTVVDWCCTNKHCNAKFERDTGYTMPKTMEAWGDASWRRWVHWRHEDLARFCKDIHRVARSVNPEFSTIIETFGGDFSSANIMGLDGAFIRSEPGFFRVWEVDSVSNSYGMKPAHFDDWMCKIRHYKFSRQCDGAQGTWAFSYGNEEVDAGLVMAFSVATRCAPYETKTPQMASTVGQGFRSRWYNWTRKHQDLLFDSELVTSAGVLHSSSSRDYVDQNINEGQFCTIKSRKEEPYWWSDFSQYSCYLAPYLSDYTGVCQVLSHNHVPFVILPMQQLEAEQLKSLSVVFCPTLGCLSDVHAGILRQYVEDGGTLVFTGSCPGYGNQYGDPIAGGQFSTLLGFDVADGTTVPEKVDRKIGKGRVLFFKEPLGRSYFTDKVEAAATPVMKAVDDCNARLVETKANKYIHFELTRLDKTILLHAVNYQGAMEKISEPGYTLDHGLKTIPEKVGVSMTLPSDVITVNRVRVDSPDKDLGSFDLTFDLRGTKLSFDFDVNQYTMVVIEIL